MMAANFQLFRVSIIDLRLKVLMRRVLSLILYHVLFSSLLLSDTSKLAFVGGRIETGTGKVIEKGVVLIEGDRIVSVAASADVEGYEVINAEGLTIYPGLINAFTTRGLTTVEPRVGEPRNAQTDILPTMHIGNLKGLEADLIASDLLDISEQALNMQKQGWSLSVFSTNRGTFRGVASLCHYEKNENGEGIVKSHAGLTLSFSTGTGQAYPGGLLGSIAFIRQTFYDAEYFTTYPDELKKHIDNESTLETVKKNYSAIAKAIHKEYPVLFLADTEVEIIRAIRIAEEFNLDIIITGGREAYKVIDLLTQKNIPVILNPSLPNAPNRGGARRGAGGDSAPDALREEQYAQWLERSQNAKLLSENGLLFAIGGFDSPENTLNNLRNLIQQGLPKQKALQAITVNSAKIFGIEQDFGTIDEGKIANLLITDGDIFDEKTKVVKTIIKGKMAYDSNNEKGGLK